MAKTSQLYETIFIVNATLPEDDIAATVRKFKELIESQATLEQFDEWGKRRLAYPIQDLTEGYYVLSRFTSAPDFPKELDRLFNISDSILRSLIIAVEENKYTKMAQEYEAKKAVAASAAADVDEPEAQSEEEDAPAQVTEAAPVAEEALAPAEQPSDGQTGEQ